MISEQQLKDSIRSTFEDLLNPNINVKEMSETRLAICKLCEFFRPVPMCAKCGCMLEQKTKLSKEKCPIGKWDAV
jgi:hypothetical protein